MTGPGHEAIVVAEEVHKSFGSLHVLRGVNLEVRAGEIVGLRHCAR